MAGPTARGYRKTCWADDAVPCRSENHFTCRIAVTPLLSDLKLTESLSELSVSNAAGQELKHKAAMSSRQAFAHTERVDMYVHSIACYKIA